jgi:hypothetical protein
VTSHLEATWGKLLQPGDCLVPLNSKSKGLVLVIGVVDEGAYMMLATPLGTKFTLEKWSVIRNSWERGETRKLSTFL